MILIFVNLLSLILWCIIISTLGNVLSALEEMYILLLLSFLFYRCLQSLVGFYACLSFLCLYCSSAQNIPSIIESGELKFPTIIVELSIPPSILSIFASCNSGLYQQVNMSCRCLAGILGNILRAISLLYYLKNNDSEILIKDSNSISVVPYHFLLHQ